MPNHTTPRHRLAACAVAAIVALGGVGVAGEALAAPYTHENTVEVYRLYNPYQPQHLYTSSIEEYEGLQEGGWIGEGLAWYAPTSSDTPIRRLYNQWTGEHLLSSDASEMDALKASGWILEEGVAFYSSDASGHLINRLYNPYAGSGSADAHLLSVSEDEVANLRASGWEVDEPSVKIYAAALAGELVEPPAPEVPEEPNEPEAPEEGGEVVDSDLEKRLAVVEYAKSFIGWPYVYAGESPEEGGFDCSGLVQYVYKHFGYDLPRTTYGLEEYLKEKSAWTTDIEEMKPGDVLVMNYSNHVGIFAGKDPESGRYMMIDAGNTNTGVVYREIFYYYHPDWSGPLQGGGSIF